MESQRPIESSTGKLLPARYTPPPLPPNEVARQAAVRALEIKQTSFDPVLDSLCKLLCSLTKVPIAGVLIVDHEKQFFIASTGRNEDGSPGAVPRSESMCQYTFLPKLPSIFVVEDCAQDQRFEGHPAVVGSGTDPPVRFFAGAPLITSEGYRIGAVCLLDSQPRSLSTAECGMLSNCAEMVMRRLEKDHLLTLHRKRTGTLLRTLDTLSMGIMLCDTGSRGWPILHINEHWSQQTGLKLSECINRTVWDVFCAAPESEGRAKEGFTDLISKTQTFTLSMMLRAKGPEAPVLEFVFQPAQVGSLGPQIQIPNSLPQVDGPTREMPYYFVLVSGKEPAGMRRSTSEQDLQDPGSSRTSLEQPKAPPGDGGPAGPPRSSPRGGGQPGLPPIAPASPRDLDPQGGSSAGPAQHTGQEGGAQPKASLAKKFRSLLRKGSDRDRDASGG